ncbi:adenine phosphoribosyltransferase [Rathayibacter toxicus]|uniref:adenine phosphoribosyltransferase n=1 Tax=Rathayibacter toxicus TaxID=145458 RepID=UPI001C044508|nr:adenine phosphoribosyltransferase [Rathayibacter toxicus]QWL32767.1 adenine phosphoribosyltransferase [Rathayibacter toxicus]QWL34862.1 adenine phosphoribosyltransferase [Rathayibacter toxicus]QWL36993.1 adenine phosphoribosyltransferase [Rathayibacter toxicus]QWL39085.1 adenine phosphoribosyltransferase [Rathayibacter toxicus]QWL41171.1 adenine phosphoribosyltransferase [Rathayibacter toxicus]
MLVTRTAAALVESLTQLVPDFPRPGILFRDLTPVFSNGTALCAVVDALIEPHQGRIDALAGVEARGFLLAAAAAYSTGLGVVTIRKPGKLPRAVLSEEATLEYGTTTLEMHEDAISRGSRLLLVDDVLATGGTLDASRRLIERAGGTVAGIAVVMELSGLGGRTLLAPHTVDALVTV